MLSRKNIDLRLGVEADAAILAGFDAVVVATGVRPRDPAIPQGDGARVHGYADVLSGRVTVGRTAAIVGAGGIGFDVAEYLVQNAPSPTLSIDDWRSEWGVADPAAHRGGLADAHPEPAARTVTLLQRKPEKPGRNLGKTTGWIHRATLAAKGVRMLGGVNYERIDREGLHVTFGEARENPTLIKAESVILCAGQESEKTLADALRAAGVEPHVIGGADHAAELDAKRAIDQGTRLGVAL